VIVIRGCNTTAVNSPLPSSLLAHRADGRIFVRSDHDARFGAKMQQPQHVACRQGGDQQLLRVIARAIAAKGRIGAGWNGHALPAATDPVITRISAVIGCAAAAIAGPGDSELVVMLFRHVFAENEAFAENEPSPVSPTTVADGTRWGSGGPQPVALGSGQKNSRPPRVAGRMEFQLARESFGQRDAR